MRVVRDAGHTMLEIVTHADQVRQLLDEVANGTREQSMGIGQIGQAVQDLDRNTQANAALVDQTAVAAASQRTAAVRMAAQVDEFRLPGAGTGAKTLAATLGAARQTGLTDRAAYLALVKPNAEATDQVMGAWFMAEPNALDGQDADQIGTPGADEKGRFAPYFFNKSDGTVGIEVRDLCFAYNDEPVLDGLNLSIAPGEKVAIVGASGGGKSTLVQLLLGLYTPQAGTIRFGGSSQQDIGLECVRENVAVVLQHPALFNDTVRANLCMGRERGDDACWRALEIAQLADTIHGLPQGLDSIVGRSGVRLSGGQRQRLAIARMVLAEPKVVILDEATSALDAATEYALHQALNQFLHGRTTLIIAHRLSAVKQADRVLVFDGGSIAEDGGHQELIAEGGLYAKLYGHLQH